MRQESYNGSGSVYDVDFEGKPRGGVSSLKVEFQANKNYSSATTVQETYKGLGNPETQEVSRG